MKSAIASIIQNTPPGFAEDKNATTMLAPEPSYAKPGQALKSRFTEIRDAESTISHKPEKMNKTGPIIIIEDDRDDQEILTEVFQKLGYVNKIIFFHDGNDALVFLNKNEVHPFLILSDINMPKLNGFSLRNMIFTNKQLQTKCIPYLFFTSAADKKSVIDAYSMSVQGFFSKPNSMHALENTIRKIIEYWQECIAPGQFE